MGSGAWWVKASRGGKEAVYLPPGPLLSDANRPPPQPPGHSEAHHRAQTTDREPVMPSVSPGAVIMALCPFLQRGRPADRERPWGP